MGNKPALRIAVTNKCNMNCQYCPKDGDSYLVEGRSLNLTDFMSITSTANKLGIDSFSITGGEPLVVPDITFPLSGHIKHFKNLNYLKLNTNGVLLERYIPEIINCGFNEIKVSLDTITPTDTHPISHYQNNVDTVIKGILAAKNYQIDIRLQTVITKKNLQQVEEIVNFAEKYNVSIKFFDLTFYSDSVGQNKQFWQKNYVSLSQISPILENKFGPPTILHAIGGYGHPNKIFTTPNGNKIMLRDTEVSAHYIKECQKCPSYPCQDGLCTLTLSTDGRIKICRPKGINLGLNLLDKNDRLKSNSEIAKILKQAISYFDQSINTRRNFTELNLPPLIS